MKIESYAAAEIKRLWRLVRTDNYTTIPGEIVSADEATGECCVTVTTPAGTKTEALNLGPLGLRIVGR